MLYDKDGDAHYDTISAFIKVGAWLRPDAALYWLAKMLYAGEDPRFILRRLIILSGEDIGLGDPMGLVVASAAAQAFDYIGMPEGVYPIVEATLYLATAPKSNTATSYFKAFQLIEEEGTGTYPSTCRTATVMRLRWVTAVGINTRMNPLNISCPSNTFPAPYWAPISMHPPTRDTRSEVAGRLERWRTAQRKALGITKTEEIPELTQETILEIKRKHKPT